jgi:type I restriction enzyme S subunit
MIAKLKPYAEYKESGEEWLGLLPAHWNQLRAKFLLREVDERSRTGKEELLSVSHLTGVTPRSQKTITMFLAKSNVGHKICRPSDVVINTMWAWMGALGVTRHTGIVSPAYGVYRPIAEQGILPRYADLLLRTPAYAAEYQRRSTGVNSSRLRLYPESFLRIPVLVPPSPEQAAIVRFLDWANGRLERTIRAKRKVIALLNEQKQAIIHRAVTRGLDPSVPLKPSGIPWLGDMPEPWAIVRNLALFSHRVEQGVPGLPVLQVSLRSGVSVEGLDQFGRPKRLIADHTKYKLVREHDLAYNTMRMWQGAVGVCSADGLVSPAYVVIRPRAGVDSRFYEVLFRTAVYKQQVNRCSTGIVSDRNRLYWESFKQIPNVRLPIEEQQAICRFVQDETGPLDTAISRLEREIDLLREHRTRLVADVVTGKLDVREAAAKLPDEATSDTSEDATDFGDDIELVDEEAAA